MQQAIQQFRLNIKSVKDLDTLYVTFSQTLPTLDLSEILRAEIVLSVSALDCYIHDLVRLGTIEIYSGIRTFDNHSIKPDFHPERLINLLTKSKSDQLLEIDNEIRKQHKTKSFQKPEMIRDSILKIGIENIWSKISHEINITQRDIEDTLQLIVERRDAIVHEADIDASIGIKRTIEHLNTIENINLIENICESIYKIATVNMI